jgi:DNA excision repair protein ERCC-2
MLDFPFESKRPGQEELINTVSECLKDGKSLLVHAPTGIGKTVSALYPAINFAKANGLTVFFLTPRHSQHIIALNTLKKMGDVKVADIVGKKWLCNALYDELGGMDFHEICNYLKKQEKCAYYNNTHKSGKGELTDEAKAKIDSLLGKTLSAQEIKDICPGLCPYEISCHLAKRSEVIIGDYFHLFNPYISETFLAKIGKKLEECIIIVDEAHQLPSRVRDLISSKLTSYILENAYKEAKDAGSKAADEIASLRLEISGILRRKLMAFEEAYLEKDDLSSAFSRLGADFMKELREAADFAKEGGKKRSYCGSLANFIDAWLDAGPDFARVAKKVKAYHGEKYELSLCALMPSQVSRDVISGSYATIVMSATLQPLSMYADLLGFKKYESLSVKGIFPRENRLNIIAPIATTRYAKRGDLQYQNYAEITEKIFRNIEGNVAAFFPSYYFLQQVEKFLKIGNKFVEMQDLTKDQKSALLNRFISSKNALLLGVQGGSFDQGIDYPDNVLKGVIIAGISLAKPDLETKSLIACYDRHYGKGMEYGYVVPAVQKAIQASGRAIRTETDKAAIIYLDERFLWANYRSVFSDQEFTVSREPWEKVKELGV